MQTTRGTPSLILKVEKLKSLTGEFNTSFVVSSGWSRSVSRWKVTHGTFIRLLVPCAYRYSAVISLYPLKSSSNFSSCHPVLGLALSK